jgi:hypothetical protein
VRGNSPWDEIIVPWPEATKEETMATKADFNAEEWSKLVEAPLLAGLRVSSASGGGKIREAIAVAKVYAAARQEQGDSALLDEIVASPPGVEQTASGDDPSAVVTARLHEALRIIDEKGSPEDTDAYRRFVVAVARAAAEAHEEGGFIGIGGRKISDEEAAALKEIQAVVDGAT